MKNINTQKGHTTTTLAVTATKMAEDARKKRLQEVLVTFHKEFVSGGTDRENEQIYKEVLWETRELTDTRKRAETAIAELKEARSANEILEGRLKRSNEQVEKLQRELATELCMGLPNGGNHFLMSAKDNDETSSNYHINHLYRTLARRQKIGEG